MTDNELINCAEECAGVSPPCSICPFDDKSPVTSECMSALVTELLDLINRQKAEIERYIGVIKILEKDVATAKSEAVKEFLEGLKEKLSDLRLVNDYIYKVMIQQTPQFANYQKENNNE